MKILVVPVSIELDGIVFTDLWRVPAMTTEEQTILRAGYVNSFGTGSQELFDNISGSPTSVYDWIFSNLKIHESRVSYYFDSVRSGANTEAIVNAFHVYFPIFDTNNNYYNSATQYTTFTTSTYYRDFYVSATNSFGTTNGIHCTMSRPDVSGVGYNIFGASTGGAFLVASWGTSQNNFQLRVPVFIIDSDDNILGVNYTVIEGYYNAPFMQARIASPDFIVPLGYQDITTLPNTFAEFVAQGNFPVLDEDPYSLGGNSGAGGGTGTFSDGGTPVGIPSLPTLSAVNTGFITLYNPSESQLQALASYMWSGPFDLNTFKKIFADPMNAILGLSIVPVDVPAGAANSVKVGNIDTGVMMTTARIQYTSVDCGSVTLPEHWGAYLDFDPYTKLDLYLPYIGIRPVSADCIIGKSVHIVYHVDILSGACSCYVAVNGAVLYTFIGQCSSSIPITGDNWTNVINGTLSIAGAVGSMVATGGASAPMAISTIASTSVNAMKPSIEKSGGMSGTGGMLSGQTPYFIVTRPEQALPVSQNHFTGYPSFITRKLENLNGYTEVELIHLENIPATSEELNEIETLLKGGVIL